MLDKLKSIDVYGHPINVLYKGGTTHNTLLGSMFTLITTVTVLLFASSRMVDLVYHNDQSISSRKISANIDIEGKIDL